ncbi:MAG: proline racemase family protein [Melioribacteraceae bacterium]|nr:proline racemase family protein [Melioribacteraceae bacterium]
MTTIKEKLAKLENWQAPEDWINIKSVDAHTGGEPLRIITSGLPELKGKTILEKRSYMKKNFDHLRTSLMWEPRGHADQYGCIITEPTNSTSDIGVIFLHNEGYSTMCGHAIIAVTKVAVETGMVEAVSPLTKLLIEAPAGLITSYAKVKDGKVESVYFHNVPSFVYSSGKIIEVPGLGNVKYDVAYGGAFYAFVKAADIDVKLDASAYTGLIEKGMAIKRAVMASEKIIHPFEEDLSFLYGTIITGDPYSKENDSRNVCVFAEGEVDRSPTGTGVSARMALHHYKGELETGESMKIESILGTVFKGTVKEETTYGKYKAVIPEVEGTAFITGKNEFVIDTEDILKDGFILR